MSTQAQERGSATKQSRANKLSQKSKTEQIRQFQQEWNAISELVGTILEHVSDSGDVFEQDDLYPRVPLAICYFVTTMLGFSPQQIVENEVMTEALFSRLPSIVASSLPNREFAGV